MTRANCIVTMLPWLCLSLVSACHGDRIVGVSRVRLSPVDRYRAVMSNAARIASGLPACLATATAPPIDGPAQRLRVVPGTIRVPGGGATLLDTHRLGSNAIAETWVAGDSSWVIVLLKSERWATNVDYDGDDSYRPLGGTTECAARFAGQPFWYIVKRFVRAAPPDTEYVARLYFQLPSLKGELVEAMGLGHGAVAQAKLFAVLDGLLLDSP